MEEVRNSLVKKTSDFYGSWGVYDGRCASDESCHLRAECIDTGKANNRSYDEIRIGECACM